MVHKLVCYLPSDAPYVVEYSLAEGNHPRYPNEVKQIARLLDEHAPEPVTITDLRNYLWNIPEPYLNRQPARQFFQDGVDI